MAAKKRTANQPRRDAALPLLLGLKSQKLTYRAIAEEMNRRGLKPTGHSRIRYNIDEPILEIRRSCGSRGPGFRVHARSKLALPLRPECSPRRWLLRPQFVLVDPLLRCFARWILLLPFMLRPYKFC